MFAFYWNPSLYWKDNKSPRYESNYDACNLPAWGCRALWRFWHLAGRQNRFLFLTRMMPVSRQSESVCPLSGDDMQWSEPRPRHIRDPKTRAQEDTLQVTHTPKNMFSLVCFNSIKETPTDFFWSGLVSCVYRVSQSPNSRWCMFGLTFSCRTPVSDNIYNQSRADGRGGTLDDDLKIYKTESRWWLP